jgi:hypothetical protein
LKSSATSGPEQRQLAQHAGEHQVRESEAATGDHEQGTGDRASLHGRCGLGYVAGDAADHEDRERREERADAAADAQRPTVMAPRRSVPRHPRGEHEESDRELGRSNAPNRTPSQSPAPPGDERGGEQGQEDSPTRRLPGPRPTRAAGPCGRWSEPRMRSGSAHESAVDTGWLSAAPDERPGSLSPLTATPARRATRLLPSNKRQQVRYSAGPR